MLGLFKNMFGGSDSQQLSETIKDGAYLVDVRTPGEFAHGSVKGAINIPLNSLPQKLAQFKGKKNIVVFCQSGGRSGMAKQILEQNGFSNTINGGGWRQVDRVMKG